MHDEQQHVLKAEPRKTQDTMKPIEHLHISSKRRRVPESKVGRAPAALNFASDKGWDID